MNGAHLHLLVNHFPIVGVILATLVLIAGFLLKNASVKDTALGLYVFSALSSLAAYFTGEQAEEIVENLAGISETLIHTHEEFAEFFHITTLILGALALLTFILHYRRSHYVRYLFIALFVVAAVDVYAAIQTGRSGGEIRHTEIRQGSGVIQLNTQGEGLRHKDEDDD
jgi:uncharacterized membrane protein